MARQIWQLKLTELHTQATQIAQEFKTIETSFGTHCVSKLLPLVVGVLERLELYVDEYEKLQTENAKLSLKLSDHDRTDSAGSGLDNYVIVVAPSDPELHTLGNRALERTSPNNVSRVLGFFHLKFISFSPGSCLPQRSGRIHPTKLNHRPPVPCQQNLAPDVLYSHSTVQGHRHRPLNSPTRSKDPARSSSCKGRATS